MQRTVSTAKEETFAENELLDNLRQAYADLCAEGGRLLALQRIENIVRVRVWR